MLLFTPPGQGRPGKNPSNHSREAVVPDLIAKGGPVMAGKKSGLIRGSGNEQAGEMMIRRSPWIPNPFSETFGRFHNGQFILDILPGSFCRFFQ